MIRRVPELLLNERNARYIDRFEPLLDFRRLPFANVDRQRRINESVVIVLIETADILWFAAPINGERPSIPYKTRKGRYSLLSV